MTASSRHTNLNASAAGRAGGVPVIFLPGIVMPAAIRYAPLIEELGDSTRAVVKELEVYATATPPAGYAIECEVDGISRAADAAGFDRFHLYGHSAGGACALAYVAAHSERILSLALDEPASDFSPEDRSALRKDLDGIAELPADEMVAAFVGALLRYRLSPERLRAFDRPVYYSHGSLSHPRWLAMRDRLAGIFPDFTPEWYEGFHHLETSHQRAPARVASALRRLWSRAG